MASVPVETATIAKIFQSQCFRKPDGGPTPGPERNPLVSKGIEHAPIAVAAVSMAAANHQVRLAKTAK